MGKSGEKAGISAEEIWERIEATAKETGKSLNQASEGTNISSGTIFGWKVSIPNVKSLAKICNFYGVSLDYMVFGKSHEQAQLKLTDQEYALLAGFRNLDNRDKEDILGNIDQKIENAKKTGILSNSGNA